MEGKMGGLKEVISFLLMGSVDNRNNQKFMSALKRSSFCEATEPTNPSEVLAVATSFLKIQTH